jgi:hypothetical protein
VSDAASSVTLIEQKSRHLLHHLMLVLMELILLMGQCLKVLAHLLGRVGGHSHPELALICQSCHLSHDHFCGVIVQIVGNESTEWKGRGHILGGLRWGLSH